MRQDDMVFLQTMNKFRIVVKKYKEYWIYSICNDDHLTILLFHIYFI
jgi:hypothetical protein